MFFAQMLHRKKAQMLRRFFRVTSAKTNLRNICAKLYSVQYTINTQKFPPNATPLPFQWISNN